MPGRDYFVSSPFFLSCSVPPYSMMRYHTHIFSAMMFNLITRTNTRKPGNHKLQFSTQTENSSLFSYTKSYLVILSQKQEETSTLYKKIKCLKAKSHV